MAEESRIWAEELLVNCSSHGIEHQHGVQEGENLAKNVGRSLTWGQLYPPNNIVGRWVDWEVNRPYPGNAHLTQAVSGVIAEFPQLMNQTKFSQLFPGTQNFTAVASKSLLGLWRIGKRFQKRKMPSASLQVRFELFFFINNTFVALYMACILCH